MVRRAKNGRRVHTRRLFALIVILLMLTACADGYQPARAASGQRPVIDSIFPVEEEIRRFKTEITADTGRYHLENGVQSRETLVQLFMRAIETRDTETMRGLLLDAVEFINVYYPTSIYTRPPYKQNPAFVWFQLQQNSLKGVSRILQRYGGQPSGYRAHTCHGNPQIQGQNKLWQHCRVIWALQPDSIQLFGTIIERNNRFKFVSYATDL